MSQSGATVSQECITAFNDLKLAKKYKFIIFKLSDDNREIVVEEASGDKDWEVFREKLVNATTKSRGVSFALEPYLWGFVFEQLTDHVAVTRVRLVRDLVTLSTTSSTTLLAERAPGWLPQIGAKAYPC
ncbi:hypothetical protein F4810DRAFT_530471 [Camillea tinctor]|nr:hypothetical protein F4810DRAFT_530471 [Camillea tinctor]